MNEHKSYKKKRQLPKNVDTSGIDIEHCPPGKTALGPDVREFFNNPISRKGRILHNKKK